MQGDNNEGEGLRSTKPIQTMLEPNLGPGGGVELEPKIETVSDYELLEKYIIDRLSSLVLGTKTEWIDSLIDRLWFEKRVDSLTPDELFDYSDCQLSEETSQRLKNAKTDTERERIIDGAGRALYIRRCAWDDFLRGRTMEKPPPRRK